MATYSNTIAHIRLADVASLLCRNDSDAVFNSGVEGRDRVERHAGVVGGYASVGCESIGLGRGNGAGIGQEEQTG
jgi:hypothetical protein